VAAKRRKKRADATETEPRKATAAALEERAEASSAGKLLRSLLVLTLVVAGFGVFALFFWYPDVPGPGVGIPIRIQFEGKEDSSQVVERLRENGLVRDPRLFSVYFAAKGGRVAPGPHLLPDDLSPRELVLRLARNGSKVKVTIPEGWTRFDIARRLEKLGVCDNRKFLDATTDKALLAELGLDGESAEGFLFPATYDLPADDDPADVVRKMVREFGKRWSTLDEQHPKGARDLADGMGWSRRQMVTLASMIEKEAVVDDERAVIASVFLNRLRDPAFTPKLLQCDPTAAYGCIVSDAPSCFKFEGKITHDMVADAKNPYNTYKHEGLPPGPIANPGAKSLEAVLAPASTHYLYFVAKGGGRHTFSETYAAHAAAIKDQKDQ